MSSDVDLNWDERGLLPAVVQDADTGALLMLAWMNRRALDETRSSGQAHFYSRSRKTLWKKGETSGNTLAVRDIRVDCDLDAILVIAEPAGPTCHTGATSCFFRPLSNRAELAWSEDDGPDGPAASIVPRLERVLIARRDSSISERSYTRSLLDRGFPKILAKIAEEHRELADELPTGDVSNVIHETADLLFHVMVGLVAREIPMDDVWRELGRRFGVSGHVEKASRGDRE